jgi:hypothetical protein
MHALQLVCLVSTLSFTPIAAAHAADLSRTAAEMDDVSQVDVKEGTPKLETLQTGGTALRFDEPFSFRVDLKARDIEPRKFDLIKLQVKADRAAFLRVAVENHPRPGDISYWQFVKDKRLR